MHIFTIKAQGNYSLNKQKQISESQMIKKPKQTKNKKKKKKPTFKSMRICKI